MIKNSTTDSIPQAYANRLSEARGLLNRIGDELDRQELGEELPQNLNWGHVSDMRVTVRELQMISDRLFHEGALTEG